MYKCTNCGKEFQLNETPLEHSYGFKNGKPFVIILCEDCKIKLNEKEREDLIDKNVNK